jgi:hypothetical protein
MGASCTKRFAAGSKPNRYHLFSWLAAATSKKNCGRSWKAWKNLFPSRFFLKDLVRSAKKVVDRLQLEKLQRRQVRPGVIQGRLEEMSIMDLMQSLEMGQKSCQLTIRRGDDTGELFFASGQCKDARMGDVEGENAVFNAVKWTDGEFEIDFNRTASRETITRTTTGLLMEGLRLIDEGQRDGQSEDAIVSDN